MGFHWSLSDSKSPQVSRTRLRILAVLSNAVIWIDSTRSPTSKSSRPFNNPLVIVPKAPITIDTIVTFMFLNFFNSLARSRYLSFFSHSFRFILWSTGMCVCVCVCACLCVWQKIRFIYQNQSFLRGVPDCRKLTHSEKRQNWEMNGNKSELSFLFLSLKWPYKKRLKLCGLQKWIHTLWKL